MQATDTDQCMVGLDHVLANKAMAADIGKIATQWRHSLRRWGRGHHDHAMQVIHARLSMSLRSTILEALQRSARELLGAALLRHRVATDSDSTPI